MKALTTEKKTDGQTYNRTKSDQDSVRYQQKTEPDFVGSGYYPPERFVPLLAKFSHPANVTQRVQLFNQLQRQYGNRYVQRVVSAYRSQNVEEEESTLASEILFRKGSGRPLEPGSQAVQRLKSGVIQAKLKIGQPNDIYEQEADRVADEVMRMPEPRVLQQPEEEEKKEGEELIQTKTLAEQITPLVQRQVEEEEEEEEVIQTKGHTDQTPEVTSDLESRINALKDVGPPLPETDRSFMERRFGVDFSSVRVHTDSNAAQISREINAQAFTHGRDIYFGAGRYNPGTSSGKKLLAHELTHVVQQSVGLNKPMIQHNISPMIQRVVRFSVNNPLKINKWTAGATNRSGSVWRIVYGDLELESDVHAEADDPAEFANWEVGFMQTERVEWNRRYWHRPNTDRRGRFLERKLKIPPAPLRDHVTNAVWYAPSAFASVSTHAAGGTTADISLTTTDRPRSSMPVSALTRSGDASDGTDNSYQFRAGMNFVNYVSARNSATNEWRHLELIYRSVQAAVDFRSDPATGVLVGTDNRTLGQSRRFRWSRAADQPAIGATLANDYVNDSSNWTLNRVEGWT